MLFPHPRHRGDGTVECLHPQIVDLGPPQRDAQLLRAHLSTADGLALPYRSWMPSESPRAIIIALHGFNDYSNFFDDPAQFFAAKQDRQLRL